MIPANTSYFDGQHCETTAAGSLLQFIGLELTEPMLFGLGEGLGYIFWSMKAMEFPFIGGRIKPDLITANLCRNLGLTLDIRETSSRRKAWENVSRLLESGVPVGLKLDCYHLEYFSTKIHFAGHYVVIYNYDDQYAYLLDTRQQGGLVKTSLESLALARGENGPMSSRHLSYSISADAAIPPLPEVVKTAIYNNAQDYLNPPIKNFGHKGILKTSDEIKKWFRTSKNPKRDFQTTAMLMERAGTGGALFRNMYRDFLEEAYQLTSQTDFKEASVAFSRIATLWTTVAYHFHETGESLDDKCIDKASDILVDISTLEKNTMNSLLNATAR